MQRVLVAGATGYLGGFVAQELKAQGYFVRALARAPEKLDALRDSLDEIVGGPQTMTWNDMAKLAFEVQGQPAKVTRLPEWLMWRVVRLARLFNRHEGELLAFFTTMATTDVVAPSMGEHSLEEHYRSLGATR